MPPTLGRWFARWKSQISRRPRRTISAVPPSSSLTRAPGARAPVGSPGLRSLTERHDLERQIGRLTQINTHLRTLHGQLESQTALARSLLQSP
jgi:hypothetical protein